jgi:hypothetical protein
LFFLSSIPHPSLHTILSFCISFLFSFCKLSFFLSLFVNFSTVCKTVLWIYLHRRHVLVLLPVRAISCSYVSAYQFRSSAELAGCATGLTRSVMRGRVATILIKPQLHTSSLRTGIPPWPSHLFTADQNQFLL